MKRNGKYRGESKPSGRYHGNAREDQAQQMGDGPFWFHGGLIFLGERLGSGDGERKTLLTRQIAFEPLPASVSFGPPFLCRSVVRG
ncbi:hypothetical protein SAMN02745166_05045 [Prosthecobacter debontii]|uniref:Uncharacterized protein n=1 Tax=Prosthecobacter debontii TaxID=48467 RepID=A0A1T4Z462_9BACT|nr:hypothetical protein SAMN02745166_05045 [Prosthecobacter debontii]